MNLQDEARLVLQKNLREADYNGKHFRYTVPSEKVYPFQWFWDSCFHAIALAGLGEIDRAKDEIESLLFWQQPDGFIPHLIYWDKSKTDFTPFYWHWLETKEPNRDTSAQIQPPVLALAINKIFEKSKDKVWYDSVLPQVELYYRYLEKERTIPEDSDLISIFAPFESGMDQSPAFDRYYFPTQGKGRRTLLVNKLLDYNPDLIKKFGWFVVTDVLVNSIYAQNIHLLGKTDKAAKILDSLIKYCWDEERGLFFNIGSRSKRKSKVATIASLMPLIIPGLPKGIASRLVEHLKNPAEFWPAFPVPSVALNEKTFETAKASRRLWRGNTWINTNWFIINGLKLQGYDSVAKKLTKKTKQLVESGYWEFYDPVTGKPGKFAAANFGWSTLAVDL